MHRGGVYIHSKVVEITWKNANIITVRTMEEKIQMYVKEYHIMKQNLEDVCKFRNFAKSSEILLSKSIQTLLIF